MKSDVVFGLENAAWPALLVGPAGNVLVANAAAKGVFGGQFSGENASLSAIWAAEIGGTPADFLARWEQSAVPTNVLKFRVAAGNVTAFNTIICQFAGEGGKWFALQLLPVTNAAVPSAEAADKAGAGDAALKQKLDCVLQLARTVSLDFNNALTGVLAHTSLLLTKAEPEHPWRRSLLEVEKSAARAAEIAGILVAAIAGDLTGAGRKQIIFMESAKNHIDLVQFDANHKLVPGDRWRVFEQHTFRAAQNAIPEPREATVADVTGDGKNDLIVLVHDRILVYPQE